MKRYIATVSFVMGLCQAVLAGPSPIYNNLAPLNVTTNFPVIDAIIFYNSSLFEVGTGAIPFTTRDTQYYTNTSDGLMLAVSGFRFQTGTANSVHNARSFFNAGIMAGVDIASPLDLYAPLGDITTLVPVYALNQPMPSKLLVFATNIVNTGTMLVGNAGLLQLTGNNVTNANGSLVAGSINTAATVYDTLDTTGLSGQTVTSTKTQSFFLDSLGVYDLFWGITNSQTEDMSAFAPPFTPPVDVNLRGGSLGAFGFPLNSTAVWSTNVFSTGVGTTNVYYNIVFINTNFADSNISTSMGFFGASTNAGEEGVIVQFSETVYDVVSNQFVTNGFYLLDQGATGTNILSVNGSSPNGYGRPTAFQVTTVTPSYWSVATPANTAYDPTIFYGLQEFKTNKLAWAASEYGFQVGRNPSVINGSFSAPLTTAVVSNSVVVSTGAGGWTLNLPDPANEPARIEINAQNFDMTQARMRAEGMVIMNVSNLIGGGTAAVDWGEMNATIGAPTGALNLSNVFPSTFQRLRGPVYAWETTWSNTQTNNGPYSPANSNAVTNVFHYHVLVVDQNLQGTFPSTVRNLTLTGKNSIVIQDPLNVINQASFGTSNLTLNSSVQFSQNAEDFTPATTPGLKNLFINTNGSLTTGNSLNVGFNIAVGPTTPVGRKYTVNTITNFGIMESTAVLLQSANFENDGEIVGYSVYIEANNLGLGLVLPETTNLLGSTGSLLGSVGSLYLSAATIQASNSMIETGVGGSGQLNLYATQELTDMVSGAPTTNKHSVIVNTWIAMDGFSMPIKPATGDLFGTEIETMVSGSQQSSHVWAGIDYGPTNSGFVNNEVIGRLVLDRQSPNSVLHFSAAGAENAMYVDYLELDDYAFSQYRSGLVIDPNFKIYFADCNLDPEKLMEAYPGLVWVSSFVGPNSTKVVPYENSTIVCLMNEALADSLEISFFNGEANFFNQPYVLNNPSNPSDYLCCPESIPGVCNSVDLSNPASHPRCCDQSLMVATRQIQGGSENLALNVLTTSVNGKGLITPNLQPGKVVLGGTYALTATPAKGWVFQKWSTGGLAASVNANSPNLSFTFVSNTVITANFIPNPFPLLQGVYDGLFYETSGVEPGRSGAFTLTLSSSGSFSGRLLAGPATYYFSSQFSGAGGAQVVAKSGAQSVTLNLQLDVTGQSGEITGDVNGGTWDAVLAADITPVWTAKNSSPLAGSYTMAMPWKTGTVSTQQGGDSFGVVTVSKLGVLSVVGTLADGSTFNASAPVNQNGQCPFYSYVASGNDTVMGWVTVSLANGIQGANVSWIKAPGKRALYPAGFTNVLQLSGSHWHAPGTQSAALNLVNPAVTLSGGDLPDTLAIPVSLKNFLTYAGANLSLTINASAGSFSGSFNNPVTGRNQSISGVVLQNENSARGLFLGADESGAVLLEGP